MGTFVRMYPSSCELYLIQPFGPWKENMAGGCPRAALPSKYWLRGAGPTVPGLQGGCQMSSLLALWLSSGSETWEHAVGQQQEAPVAVGWASRSPVQGSHGHAQHCCSPPQQGWLKPSQQGLLYTPGCHPSSHGWYSRPCMLCQGWIWW